MTACKGFRWLTAMLAAAASCVALAAAPAGAAAATGFGPLAGTGGCFVTEGTTVDEAGGVECHVGKGLLGAKAVAVSPDGANVYVAGGTPGDIPAVSFGDVAILKRDPTSGALTPVGCLSSDGTDGRDGASGACTATPSLLGADGVAVSPDGLTVYVTSNSSASVVAFARDPASGSLTRLGCLQGSPRPGSPCRSANVFITSGPVLASADNTALYVAAPREGALSSITPPAPPATSGAGGAAAGSRATAASMFMTPPAAGDLADPCIAVNGLDGECAVGTAMRGLGALALSADGKQVYGTAVTSKAIDVFSANAEGGLSETGCLMVELPPTGLCTGTKLLEGPTYVASSPDGKNVYVSDSGSGTGKVVALARNESTGQLSDASCTDFLPKPSKEEPGEENPEESAEEKRDREKEERKAKEEKEHEPPDPCSRVPGLESVSVVAVSGDGSLVYTFGNRSAAIFSRDPATGKLAEASCAAAEDSRCTSLPALTHVDAAAVSPDGRDVYVVGAGKGAVTAFSIGAAVTTRHAAATHAGTARVRVVCPAAMRRPCRGHVELAALRAGTRQHRRHSARHGARRGLPVKRIALGDSRRFTIRPGAQAVIAVQLSRGGEQLLRSRRHLRLAAVVRSERSGGGSGFGRRIVLTLARF